MNVKNSILALLVTAAIAVLLYRSSVYDDGDAPSGKPTIALVTGGAGPYWQLIASGAQAAAKELPIVLTVMMPESDENLDSQVMLLNSLDTSQVDAVALSPLDAEAQARKIDQLAENALLVTVDSDAPLSSRLSYVGASNLAAGIQCGEQVKEALPDGGGIVVLMANNSKYNMLQRKKGFLRELYGEDTTEAPADSDYDITHYLVDEGDDQRCEDQLREVLQADGEAACIVGMNARHGPIVLKVLGELDRLGTTPLITFDTPDETLQGIEDGHIFATIAQDPYQYGYEATHLLYSFSRRTPNQLPPPGLSSTMYINTTVVRKDNVAEFKKLIERRSPSGAGA